MLNFQPPSSVNPAQERNLQIGTMSGSGSLNWKVFAE